MLELTPVDSHIAKQAFHFYGATNQIMQAMEEAGELTAACNHYLRKRVGCVKELASEIADMRIMLEQLTLVVGEDAVSEEIAFKLDRLNDRVGHIVVGSGLQDHLDGIAIGGTD